VRGDSIIRKEKLFIAKGVSTNQKAAGTVSFFNFKVSTNPFFQLSAPSIMPGT